MGFRWGLVLALQVLQSHMVTQKQGHAGVNILLQKNCKLQFLSCRQKGRNKHAKGVNSNG
jgi:hypothetical protein